MLPPAPPRTPLRVLGIDPGTRLMGWGVVEAVGTRLTALGHGVLRAAPSLPVAERLLVIAKGLREVVARHAPHEAALEEVFYGKDAHAAARIGEGRGAALLVLAEAGVPVQGYPNNVVKKSVTGGGRAEKERVRDMVLRILALTERPETLDASDALALAICHHQRRGLGGSGGGLPPRVKAAIERASRARPAASKP